MIRGKRAEVAIATLVTLVILLLGGYVITESDFVGRATDVIAQDDNFSDSIEVALNETFSNTNYTIEEPTNETENVSLDVFNESNDGTEDKITLEEDNLDVASEEDILEDELIQEDNSVSDFSGGDGSAGSPYQITNCTDLQAMENDLDANYTLMNDIDCSDTKNWNYNGSQYLGFDPVGERYYDGGWIENLFTGNFNGNGYKINNIYINRSSENYVGLFGYIYAESYSDEIKIINVELDGLDITGADNSGGLIGYVRAINGTLIVNNSYSSGIIKGADSSGLVVGGLSSGNTDGKFYLFNLSSSGNASGSSKVGCVVGDVLLYPGILLASDLYSDCNVSGNSGTGGILGRISTYGGNSTITESYSRGKVMGNFYAGGFVGNTYSSQDGISLISKSYSRADVNGTSMVGGFVGNNYADQGVSKILDSFAKGNIANLGGIRMGGFAGQNCGYKGKAMIVDSYSLGNVTGDEYIGGLVGDSCANEENSSSNISNSFSTGKATGNNYIGGLLGYKQEGLGENLIINSYWNNNSINGDYCWTNDTSGYDVGCIAIQNDESYFKGDVYPGDDPMSNWEFYSVWQERVGDYPSLTWQGIGGIVVEEPDHISMILDKESLNSSVAVGDTAEFVINITNNGTINATGYLLFDEFNYSYINYSSAIPEPSYINYTAGELEWDINISNKSTVMLYVNFTAIAGGNGTNLAELENETEGIVAYDIDSSYVTNVPVDAYEPDDDFGSAKWIDIDGNLQEHSFHIIGENDTLKFNATEGHKYVIETSIDDTSDTYLYLYSPTQSLLDYNDDIDYVGGNYASRIIWYNYRADGTYYVRVRDRWGEGGRYNVSVLQYGLPEGHLADPSENINVSLDRFFNITTTVKCEGGPCENIVAKLDPRQKEIDPELLKKTDTRKEEKPSTDSSVEEKIYSEGEARVIVTLKDGKSPSQIKEKQEKVLNRVNTERRFRFFKVKVDDFKPTHKYDTLNAMAGKINRKGLEKLKNDPDVEKIQIDHIGTVNMDTSAPIIHAPEVWNLTYNGKNITGKGETVCVIDTGIDTDHPFFDDRIIGGHCYCSVSDYGSGGCCSDNTAESNVYEDDEGHGTHVAGTVASSDSTYKGIAPEANIVAIKVCNSSGSCAESDYAKAVEWCINNASLYNISVITMSIGSNSRFDNASFCDGYNGGNAFNTAYAYGLFTTVASGNQGDAFGISYPACATNATSVGATEDDDDIASFTNAEEHLLDYMAPGHSIMSAANGGGVTSKQGTSMATPHVAGAAALLKQYYKERYDANITVEQMRKLLKHNGDRVFDVLSNADYNRIDLQESLIEKGVVPEEEDWSSGMPFYTVDINPRNDSCLESLQDGEECNTTWTVNATRLGTWEFFTIYEYKANESETPRFNVTVKNSKVPSVDNFETSYGTTNFSALEDLDNVGGMVLATQYGKIEFPQDYDVDASNEDYDSYVKIEDGYISVDSDNLHPSFNSTMNITLSGVSCPATIYYGSGTYSSASDILDESNVCSGVTDPQCVIHSCSGDTVLFTASHFTGYASGSGKTELTIWDDNDDLGGSQNKGDGDVIGFYANYTNTTDIIADANCTIMFNDSSAYMDYNSTLTLFDYYRTFTQNGSYNYNVTCNRTNYTELIAYDNAKLGLDTKPQLDYIILNPTKGMYNSSVEVSTHNASDEDGDTLKLMCGNKTGTYNLCNSTFGPAQRSCSFLSPWEDNSAHYIYCKVTDGINSSLERNAQFTSDNIPPTQGSILNVEGDTSAKYWDTDNDDNTVIQINYGESNMSCRFDTVNETYDNMNSSNECMVSGSIASCNVWNITGEQTNLTTAYISCQDKYGNDQPKESIIRADYGVDWTKPSVNDNNDGNIHNPGYTVTLTINDMPVDALVTVTWCNDTSGACIPGTVFSGTNGTTQLITFNERGTWYLRWNASDAAGNLNGTKETIIFINDLMSVSQSNFTNTSEHTFFVDVDASDADGTQNISCILYHREGTGAFSTKVMNLSSGIPSDGTWRANLSSTEGYYFGDNIETYVNCTDGLEWVDNLPTSNNTVPNIAPDLAVSIPDQIWNEDNVNTINLSDYFVEYDLDDMNFSSTQPENISVQIDNDTSIVTLTPNPEWYGETSIIFTAYDVYGWFNVSNNITLTVSSVNDVPEVNLTNLTYVVIDEDSYNDTINLSEYVSDVEDADEFLNWSCFTNNSDTSAYANNLTKILNISSTDNNTESFEVNCSAEDTDGDSNSSVFIVDITAINDAPVLSTLPNVTLDEDMYNDTINLSEYAFDVDNTLAELNWTTKVNDSNINVFANNNTKYLNISAVADWNGEAYANVTVHDPEGLIDTYSFMIVVFNAVNDAPTQPVVNITPSNPIRTDDLICNVTSNSTDAEGDPVEYWFNWYVNNVSNRTIKTSLNFDIMTSGNLSDNQTWECNVTPTDNQLNGTHGSDSVKIQNAAPEFDHNLTNQSAYEDTAFIYDINCSDINLDPVIYSDNSSLFEINSSTGLIQDIPIEVEAGNYSVEIGCADPLGLNNTQTFVYEIINLAPVISPATPNLTYTQDVIWSYDANTTDDTDNLTWYVNSTMVSLNSTTGVFNDTTTESEYGSYKINLTVVDMWGASDTNIFTYNILDINPPTVTLVQPTPVNDTRRILNYAIINATTSETNNVTSCMLEWNGVNTTMDLSGNICNVTMITSDAVTYVYKVWASDDSGNWNVSETRVFRENDKPIISLVNITTDSPHKYSILNCTADWTDNDGDSASYYYRWFNDTSIVSGESGRYLNCSENDCEKGDNLTCEATPWDGYENGTVVNGSVIIINEAPLVDMPANITFYEEEHNDTINLSDYMTDVDNDESNINWTYGGSTVNLTIMIDNITKMLNISADENFFGERNVTFYAHDSDGGIGSDWSMVIVFGVNDVPTWDTINVTPTRGRYNSTVTIVSVGANDVDGNTVSMRCGTSDCTPGVDCHGFEWDLCNSSYGMPEVSCSFKSPWADNSNHDIYCRLYQNESSHTERRIRTFRADNTIPSAFIVETVAGDSSIGGYWDTQNDDKTMIVGNVSETGVSCRFNDTDLGYYQMGSSDSCTVFGTRVECNLGNISQEVNKTYYVSCADQYGNGQNSTQNAEILFSVDYTSPSTYDNHTGGVHLPGYEIMMHEVDIPLGTEIDTWYCVDLTGTCIPNIPVDDGDNITFNTRGVNHLRYYSNDSATPPNMQTPVKDTNVMINRLLDLEDHSTTNTTHAFRVDSDASDDDGPSQNISCVLYHKNENNATYAVKNMNISAGMLWNGTWTASVNFGDGYLNGDMIEHYVNCTDGLEYVSDSPTNNTIPNELPIFVSAQDNANYVAPAQEITIITESYDPDNDQIILYVCNSSAVNYSGCMEKSYCNSTGYYANATCNMTAETSGGIHEWFAYLYDNLGAKAIQNYSGNYTTDANAPIITQINPINENVTRNITPGFLFNATDDYANSVNCTLYLNDSGKGNLSISANSTGQIISSVLSEGTYEWYVNCTDEVGNKGQSGTRNISIDLTPPQSSIVDPSDGEQIFSGDIYVINGTASDNHEVSKVELNISGMVVEVNGINSWNYTWNLSDGKYILRSRAMDLVGNVETAIENVTVYVYVNSTVENSTVINTTLEESNITNSTAEDSIINNSYIENSTVINCTIINSTFVNSTCKDSTVINTNGTGWYIDPSTVDDSTCLGNCTVIDSVVVRSTLEDVLINLSDAYDNEVEGLREIDIFMANLTNENLYDGNITYSGYEYAIGYPSSKPLPAPWGLGNIYVQCGDGNCSTGNHTAGCASDNSFPNCNYDCGSCAAAPTGGGGGGGGGGSSYREECRDNKDNDGDGKIDWPEDPGCSDMYDDDETDLPICFRNWICTAWKECTEEGTQTRICWDDKDCDREVRFERAGEIIGTEKPEEIRECEYVECSTDDECDEGYACLDGSCQEIVVEPVEEVTIPIVDEEEKFTTLYDIAEGNLPSIVEMIKSAGRSVSGFFKSTGMAAAEFFKNAGESIKGFGTKAEPVITDISDNAEMAYGKTSEFMEDKTVPLLYLMLLVLLLMGGIYGGRNIKKTQMYQNITHARNLAKEERRKKRLQKIKEKKARQRAIDKKKREKEKAKIAEEHARKREENTERMNRFLEGSVNKGYSKRKIIKMLSSNGWNFRAAKKYVDKYFSVNKEVIDEIRSNVLTKQKMNEYKAKLKKVETDIEDTPDYIHEDLPKKWEKGGKGVNIKEKKVGKESGSSDKELEKFEKQMNHLDDELNKLK